MIGKMNGLLSKMEGPAENENHRTLETNHYV